MKRSFVIAGPIILSSVLLLLLVSGISQDDGAAGHKGCRFQRRAGAIPAEKGDNEPGMVPTSPTIQFLYCWSRLKQKADTRQRGRQGWLGNRPCKPEIPPRPVDIPLGHVDRLIGG